MGEFEALTTDEALAASVRAGPGAASDTLDNVESAALAARQRQLFNRDDLRELKAQGCVGEGAGATLVAHPCDKTAEAAVATLRDRLVKDENADRQSIVTWAIATDPVLTSRDRAQVVALYHRLLLEQASKGEWLQNDDGTWTQH